MGELQGKHAVYIEISIFFWGITIALSNTMKQPIFIIQQLEHEPPGMITDIIRDFGYSCDILMAQEVPIPQAILHYSGLIIMGGHMSANDSHLPFIARQIQLLK